MKNHINVQIVLNESDINGMALFFGATIIFVAFRALVFGVGAFGGAAVGYALPNPNFRGQLPISPDSIPGFENPLIIPRDGIVGTTISSEGWYASALNWLYALFQQFRNIMLELGDHVDLNWFLGMLPPFLEIIGRVFLPAIRDRIVALPNFGGWNTGHWPQIQALLTELSYIVRDTLEELGELLGHNFNLEDMILF